MESRSGQYGFADGVRYLELWERKYLEDALTTELTGKRLIELTYSEWLEQVYNVMQVRNQFVGAVEAIRMSHLGAVI